MSVPLLPRRPVVVVPYNPEWPRAFERLRRRAAGALGELAVAIEHVGSTSVPGLAAKPIVDLDVVVPSAADVPAAIERLATIGYTHRGDLGIPGREAFSQPPGPDEVNHHLYVCPADGPDLRRHLAFRDYLRAHPAAARAYEAVKLEGARRFPDDREAYQQYKGAVVEEILQRALALAAEPAEAAGAPETAAAAGAAEPAHAADKGAS